MKSTFATYLYIVFILLFALSSCEDDVDLKDLGVESKLVLHCRLSPDLDTISAYLTNSQPILGGSSEEVSIIKNATVEISSDNTNWVNLTYNSAKKRYTLPQSEFLISEGKTYFIRAHSPNYKKAIFSSCTVPYYRDVQMKIEHKETIYGEIKVNFIWKDYPNEKNFYVISAYSIHQETGLGDGHIWYIPVLSDSTQDYLFTDINQDGATMKGVYIAYSNDDTLIFNFIQIDEPTYLFEKSMYYNYYIDFMGFVEPTLVYNNIKDGYGLFSAFRFKTYRYIFKTNTLEEVN